MGAMRERRRGGAAAFVVLAAAMMAPSAAARAQGPAPAPGSGSAGEALSRELLDRYCVTCHSARVVRGEGPAPSALVGQLRSLGLELDALDPSAVGDDAETWEKVVRKLRAGAMPPAGRPRPEDEMRDAFVERLEAALDAAWAARAELPRTAVYHRLNRAEYRNVVRDLLDVDVDVTELLPPDDATYGFDNIADALTVSPLLLERYLSAARRIGRLAIGPAAMRPTIATYLARTDLTQDDHIAGLPLGTQGGMAVRHHFPLDGEYVVRLRLRRSVIDTIRGLAEPYQIEVNLDRERVRLFTIGGEQPCGSIDIPCGPGQRAEVGDGERAREAALAYAMDADAELEVRLHVPAGRARSRSRSCGRPPPSTTGSASRCSRATSTRSTRDGARRICGAWRSSVPTTRPARATRRAAGGSSSARRPVPPTRPRAPGRSCRRWFAGPTGGR